MPFLLCCDVLEGTCMTTCFWLASSLTLTLLQKSFFEVYTGKLCGLLHLDRVPLCLCCCILCSCHQGLSCCVLCGPQCPPRFLLPHSMRFALMFLLLHSVGSPLCYVAAFSAILTKASALPSLQIPLRVLLLHFFAASTKGFVTVSCAQFTKVSYCCLWFEVHWCLRCCNL